MIIRRFHSREMFREILCSGNILGKISQEFRKHVLPAIRRSFRAWSLSFFFSRRRCDSGNGRNSASSANYIVRTIGRIGFATDSQHMRRTREKCHAASVVAARAWQCALSRRESSPGVLRLCIIDPTHGRHNVRGHVSRALTSNWRNKPPRKTAAARVLSFRYTLRGNLHTLRYVIATLYVRTLTFVAVHYNVQSSYFHSYRDFLMFRNVV